VLYFSTVSCSHLSCDDTPDCISRDWDVTGTLAIIRNEDVDRTGTRYVKTETIRRKKDLTDQVDM
jgi:hypothetical protein